MSEVSSFLPDWASPPGDTINDLLEERGHSLKEFAQAIHSSADQAQQLINGTAHITAELAENLALVFGISAAFWLAREAQFRESLARVAENENWVKEFPIADLLRFKWIPKVRGVEEKIAACLDFFDVPSVTEWYERYEGKARLTAFRTSKTFTPSEGAVLAWLRRGEIEAEAIKCADWSPEKFKAALPAIRALTQVREPSDYLPELERICAECGVAVVLVRAPAGCGASGSTRFVTPNKAVVMLSARYRTDDQLWFTFFHEAGHLLLHDNKTLFLEGGDLCTGKEEEEANEFSSEQLIPKQHQAELLALPRNAFAISRFAKKIGISPGIVVGQLQHRKLLSPAYLNNLKIRYTWSDQQ